MKQSERLIRWLSILTSLVLLMVVMQGALVTNTGSQDGCGSSWPLCYGQVIPQNAQKQTIIELSHRAVSGLAAILVVIQAIWIWIKFPKVKETKFLAIVSVFFLVLQALLGAGAVIWNQSSLVLALHFGISLISFASVLLITILVFEETWWHKRTIPAIGKGMLVNVVLLCIYSYIVIYSGAFVRHTDSSMGCLDFPLCNGTLIPDLYSRAGIQFIHRLLAGALVVWVFITLVISIVRYKHSPSILIGFLLSLIFILCQAISGILVVLTRMQLTFLLLHSFFITCFFAVLTILLMFVLRRKEKQP
ncbi:cytochrome c oxidase assembly protein subunit 15 [Scopulibacillus daqui]|uniref:Heme A synthase n=1 Tax=Scopulibacillus daqui TaxID=1469162 RepID=A0ABS2PXK2_9BACL|nr:heme A synthase [Scopulibacillus daqui]MBM7644224.1 cytochrome c oxidase assembly protein subunit 15 [Scopulibacillus daqui]